jgi:cobalamin biosynthesis protein CobT
MSDFFQEKRKIVLFIGIILFLLLGLLYFYLIMPLKDDANAAEQNVKQLETEVKALENRLNQNETDQPENTAKLEKKMPLSRQLDELILSLQEIEMVSGSQIASINFNNYDGGLTEADGTNENNESTDGTDEATADDTNNNNEATDGTDEATTNETDENQSDEQATEDKNSDDNGSDTNDENEQATDETVTNLPTNVKLITINLSVASPDFEHFQLFLQELEKLERITRVDTLTFTKPAERELLYEKDGSQAVTADVQITTFYYNGVK